MRFDKIDKIFCINLQKRIDRKNRCINIFKNYQINVDFFTAIDGRSIKYANSKIKPGAVGCCMSHAAIYKIINENSWENTLILEDDVDFHPNIAGLLDEFYAQVPSDWHLLYYGGNHNQGNQNYPMPQKINKNVHKLFNTYTTHCYLVNRKAIPYLLEEFMVDKILNQEADVHLANIQRKVPCYGYFPHLAWQIDSFSDIEGSFKRYDFLR